jgi:hypothetical protein
MKIIGSFTGLITLFLFLFLNMLPGSALAVPKAPEPDSAGKTQIVENYGKLPLSFEKNQGQTDEKVGFLSRGGGYTLFLTPDEAVLALRSPLKDEGLGNKQNDASQVSRPEKQKMAKGAVIRMKFSGANTAPVISGQERLQETSNYFIGNAYVTGETYSSDFPKVNALYPNLWGVCDAFIAKISDATAPVPDIKANGVDEFLTISSTENIKITISLASGDREGIPSDCWISADTPFGLYWYILESQDWKQSDTPILTAQIPLTDVIDLSVFDGTLTDGHYIFNFAVDDNADGLFDKTWSDSVELYVVPCADLEPVDDEPLGNRTPLILVHGNNSETKDQYRWGDFIERAGQDSDFAGSYKMYLFRWDSSLSNKLNGLALGCSIDNEEDLHNREVVILARSRGGIVSRYYMNDYVTLNGGFSGQPGGEHVKYLVTLATPHRGSPGADPVWSIFSFDYNYFDVLSESLSLAYMNKIHDANYIYLQWDDVDNELTDEMVCWNVAYLNNNQYCGYLLANQTDLLALNQQESYLGKIIAYGGNEFDGKLSKSGHEEFISRIQEEKKIEMFYDHWALSYFSGLMADMPVIPNGYPVNPIDDNYRRFQANDGMVPLDSALLLKPGSGNLFHVEGGNLVFDEDELRNHCQVNECNIIMNRQTDHMDFLDDDQVIDIILNRLKTL